MGERRPNPIIEALDIDRDHNISAEEIKAATSALLTLDKNKDGQLSPDEYRPAGAGGPGPGGRQGSASGRPAGLGGRQGGPSGPAGPGPGGREQGPPPPEHDPEHFVRHAMEFDADNDGKLDRDELLKFAAQLPPPPQGGPLGPGGGEGGPRGRGPRGGAGGSGGQPSRPTRPASDE